MKNRFERCIDRAEERCDEFQSALDEGMTEGKAWQTAMLGCSPSKSYFGDDFFQCVCRKLEKKP